MVRFGELTLVIRTQDYAARNLDRISASLGRLSKAQQLSRSQAVLSNRQARISNRLTDVRGGLQNLEVLRQNFSLQKRIADVETRRLAVGKQLSTAQAGMAATGRVRGPAGRFLPAAAGAAAMTQLQSRFDLLRGVEADLLAEQARLNSQISQLDPKFKRLANSEALASRATKQLSRDERRLAADLAIVQGDLAHVEAAMKKLPYERMHRIGQTLSRMGRVLQLAGATGVLAFGAAANAAANFEQQVSLAATQARDIGGTFDQVGDRAERLRKFILEAGRRFPASAEEMARAAYEIFSSLDLATNGAIDFGKGLRLLNVANRIAVAGGVSLDDSIKGLVITLNNFDPALKHVNSTINTMFDIVRFGNIHVDEFTQMMNKVAPAAKGAGFSLGSIAGPLSFLTRVMASPRVATGFARLVDIFTNRDFRRGFMELSRQRLGEAFDVGKITKGPNAFLNILKAIVRAAPEVASGQIPVINFLQEVARRGRELRTGRPAEGLQFTSQGRQVLTQLLQNYGSVAEIQAQVLTNQGEFNRAWQVMRQTPAVQWQIMLNTLKLFAIEIGHEALPAMLALGAMFISAIDWFRNLDPRVKNLAIKIAVFAAAASLIGGVMLSVVGGMIAFAGSIAILSGGLGEVGGTGVVGRLATMLTLLRTLSLIGAVVVTVTVLFNVVAPKAGDWLRGHLPGFKQLSDFATKNVPKTLQHALETNPASGFWANVLFGKEAKKKLNKAGKKAADELSWDAIQKKAKQLTKQDWLKGLTEAKGSLQDFINQNDAVAQNAIDTAEVIRQANEQAMQSVEQAAANMTNTWNQFLDQNKQAFGELFQGPFFQGETWSLAKEWDVKPTMKEINRDLREQLKQFRTWRNTLAAISRKRGVTPELMQELQALGPDALDNLKVLRRASGPEWDKFISMTKTKQQAIKKATQIDFDAQLKQWFKYGKGIAEQIILGLRSENVALDNAFKKYILRTFPDIFPKARQQALAEARRQQREHGGGGVNSNNRNNNNTTNSNNQTIHVHPAKGESTKDAQKRAAWEARKGKRGAQKKPPANTAGSKRGGGGFG
jgi:Phage-related minor tail protein